MLMKATLLHPGPPHVSEGWVVGSRILDGSVVGVTVVAGSGSVCGCSCPDALSCDLSSSSFNTLIVLFRITVSAFFVSVDDLASHTHSHRKSNCSVEQCCRLCCPAWSVVSTLNIGTSGATNYSG